MLCQWQDISFFPFGCTAMAMIYNNTMIYYIILHFTAHYVWEALQPVCHIIVLHLYIVRLYLVTIVMGVSIVAVV